MAHRLLARYTESFPGPLVGEIKATPPWPPLRLKARLHVAADH